MQQYETLSHCKWECKYHLVFIPKGRKKVLFGHIQRRVGQMLRQLCSQKKGVEIIEGHLMGDHVHVCLSIPPKYSVADVVGFLKGKTPSGSSGSSKGNDGILAGCTFGRAATL